MEINEIWKDVKGYEGKYQISNMGNVRSLDRYIKAAIRHVERILRKGQPITPKFLPNGYKFVILYNGKKQKMWLIHRLVALAFLPNPDNKRCVNHKDADKGNNILSNLEWSTHKENSEHALSLNLFWSGERCSFSKLTEAEVTAIRARRGTISGRKLGTELGISNTNIYDIWNRKVWKHIA